MEKRANAFIAFTSSPKSLPLEHPQTCVPCCVCLPPVSTLEGIITFHYCIVVGWWCLVIAYQCATVDWKEGKGVAGAGGLGLLTFPSLGQEEGVYHNQPACLPCHFPGWGLCPGRRRDVGPHHSPTHMEEKDTPNFSFVPSVSLPYHPLQAFILPSRGRAVCSLIPTKGRQDPCSRLITNFVPLHFLP